VNWTAIAGPQFISKPIRFIAYGGGKFVAVGDSKYPNVNRIAYSSMANILAELIFNLDGSVGWVRAQ
jgi:hypothetical protein